MWCLCQGEAEGKAQKQDRSCWVERMGRITLGEKHVLARRIERANKLCALGKCMHGMQVERVWLGRVDGCLDFGLAIRR